MSILGPLIREGGITSPSYQLKPFVSASLVALWGWYSGFVFCPTPHGVLVSVRMSSKNSELSWAELSKEAEPLHRTFEPNWAAYLSLMYQSKGISINFLWLHNMLISTHTAWFDIFLQRWFLQQSIQLFISCIFYFLAKPFVANGTRRLLVFKVCSFKCTSLQNHLWQIVQENFLLLKCVL